jgi:hypothetical protein
MYVDYEYRVTVICVYCHFPRFLQRLPDLIEEEIPDIKNKVTIEATSISIHVHGYDKKNLSCPILTNNLQ